MDNAKRELTLDELKKQLSKIGEEYSNLNEIIKKREVEEEDRKRAQLALEKETRKKEVDEALEKYRDLLHTYLEDYGSYSNIRMSDLPWWAL